MIERALTFGDWRHLVGILTEPAPELADPAKPAVIFLNSGILHRVGASRMYVKVARRIAASGFLAFRFDHAGIGDSDVRRDDRSFQESAIREARAAMDLLRAQRGTERFVLAGLCSGSDIAYWTALEDERVVGLVQLDPFLYRTRRFLIRYYLPRLVSPAAWWRSFRSRSLQLIRRLSSSKDDATESSVWVAPEYTRIFPPREEIAMGLRRLSDRGVGFRIFISGSMDELVNYPDQFRESFPEVEFGSNLEVDYTAEADHTVTGLEDQERVASAVEGWMVERFR